MMTKFELIFDKMMLETVYHLKNYSKICRKSWSINASYGHIFVMSTNQPVSVVPCFTYLMLPCGIIYF